MVWSNTDMHWYMSWPTQLYPHVAWCSGNAFDLINEVTVRQAWLVLRWVTACGQVNHLGM